MIFNRKALLDVVYQHMGEVEFARKVLSLRVEREESEDEDTEDPLSPLKRSQ